MYQTRIVLSHLRLGKAMKRMNSCQCGKWAGCDIYVYVCLPEKKVILNLQPTIYHIEKQLARPIQVRNSSSVIP